MIGRPPDFTPFPYTTRFRSRGIDRQPGVPAPAELRAVGRVRLEQTLLLRTQLAAPRPPRLGEEPRHERHHDHAAGVPEDRKSTRLNSSHANISYAVFCLKKK